MTPRVQVPKNLIIYKLYFSLILTYRYISLSETHVQVPHYQVLWTLRASAIISP